MPATYIILVNYNGCRDTIECLESLLRLDTTDSAVVIVDNGSHDGSITAIEEWAQSLQPKTPLGPPWHLLPKHRIREPKLRVISLHTELEARPDESNITVIDACENLGFAKANNVGMEFAVRDPEARHFWILNNDTVVRPDALQILERYAGQHPASGIIGTTLLYYDRPEIVQGYGGWMTPSKALAGHIGYGMQADISPSKEQIEENLAYIMGASMFVSREAFRSTGGMSENYFLYFEEADWARRLPRTLQQSVCVDAVVYHKEGGSIGTSSSSRSSDTSLYYLTVNSLRFYWAFERKFIGIMAARIVWNELRHIKHGDWAAVRVALTAGRDFVLGRRRRGRYGSAEFNAKSYAFDEDP